MEPEQAEREAPSMDDTSECMDFDNEVVDDTPADCYDVPCSHEIS